MLDRCAAIHMAPDRDWSARCGALMRDAGMGEAYPFLGVDDIARRVRKTHIQFLIVHYRTRTAELAATLGQLRHHREAGVRFMPVIVFTRDSGASTALDFLKMGCDDIITFPCTRNYLAERLTHQIGRKIDYVHAGSYFGLDRPSLREDEPGEPSECFTIHRDPVHGIKVTAQKKSPARGAG